MVLALTSSPDYPTPGTVVTLDVTGATGTSREFELTSRPSQSVLPLARLTNLAGDPIATFTPDQPGEYGFKAYDYRDTGFAPARWASDVTAQRGKRLLASATGIVYVGEFIELPIVTLLGHGATLRLTVVNDTVRAATLVSMLTEVSRLASLTSAVTDGLAGMVSRTVSALGNNLATGAANLMAKYEAHRANTSGSPAVHSAADDVNAMLRAASSAYASQAYAITQLNEVRDRLENHQRSGSSSGGWHRNDDTKNTFMVGPASDIASATVLLADAGYRVFSRHILQVSDPQVHGSEDTTNALVTIAPLTTFIVAFLDAIEIIDPSIPAGESEGAGDASHMYGFTRA